MTNSPWRAEGWWEVLNRGSGPGDEPGRKWPVAMIANNYNSVVTELHMLLLYFNPNLIYYNA